jgi:hypothetical protein
LSFLKISDSPNTKIILVNNGIDNRLIVARQLLHPVESIWRQVVGGSVVPPFFPGSLSRPVPSDAVSLVIIITSAKQSKGPELPTTGSPLRQRHGEEERTRKSYSC